MFIEPPISSRLTDVDPQRLRREQVNILYRALPLSLLTILIHAVALAMIQSVVVPLENIAIWLAAILLLVVLRWHWHVAYARRNEQDTRNDQLWLQHNLLGIFLSGLVWGSASFLLFPSGDLLHQIALMLVVLSICAGSASTVSAFPLAVHTFLTLALVPMAVRLLMEGGAAAMMLIPILALIFLVVNLSAVRGYATILTALTSRLALEKTLQELRDSTGQNRLLLESVSEGIFGTDKDGVTTFVNPAAAAMLGYETHELIGKPMHGMIHHCHKDGSFYPSEECPMESTLREGVTRHLTDEVLWRKDGTAFPVEYRSTPVMRDGVVSGAVVSFSNIAARKKAEAQLERQAFYDSLTGLPNRVLVEDRLEQAVAHARRHNKMGALIFLDLDQFKMINDTLGHASGDTLLKEMAVRLKGAIRREDTAARMGGDEFVVLLGGLPGDSDRAVNIIRRIADKIHQRLSLPFVLNGHRLQVTSSVGIAMFPINSDDADAIMKQADAAMYRAKESGRNNTQFFLPSMQLIAEERLAMQNDLRQAIQRNQLKLYYQPQYDQGGAIVGAEALLRWQHPNRGMVQPQAFISVAEESGIILPVGEWVLQQGCEMLRRCADPDEPNYLPRLSINVSPYQFRQPEFVTQVHEVIERSGIKASRLELELTENILLDDIDGVALKMRKLKQLGVRFSLDDFGTGYSSLAYLRKLPLDQLKIDQSFVRDIPHDQSSLAIVETIISMTQHLELEVIAEGVEEQDQLEALSNKGCYLFQGFLLDRPMSEEDFIRRLQECKSRKRA